MPPDLRAAGSGDIDSSMLQTSTNRLLLQSWLPDGGSTQALSHKSKPQGTLPWIRRLADCPPPRVHTKVMGESS